MRALKPASGRIAVKVINHLGDEVMKVFQVWACLQRWRDGRRKTGASPGSRSGNEGDGDDRCRARTYNPGTIERIGRTEPPAITQPGIAGTLRQAGEIFGRLVMRLGITGLGEQRQEVVAYPG